MHSTSSKLLSTHLRVYLGFFGVGVQWALYIIMYTHHYICIYTYMHLTRLELLRISSRVYIGIFGAGVQWALYVIYNYVYTLLHVYDTIMYTHHYIWLLHIHLTRLELPSK